MAKASNQKLKILYLLKILFEKTDEDHPMSVSEMISELAKYDISAERKSIYDDIEALRMFGVDVVLVKGKAAGYYIGERVFELPELKLLVDSVQSSKFITHRKTLSLIKKIESLASVHDGQLLQRQVYVHNRVKSMNESVYYNVDEISNAITFDRMIRYKYFEYTVSKKRQYRHNGEFYEISPFGLMWDDENYYMLGWDDNAGMMKHYRVDKMANISITENMRMGKEYFGQMDMSLYSKKVFGMFTGKEETVKLRFKNNLIGAVLDRFGMDSIIIKDGEEHFIVNVTVALSPLFFSWLFAFGNSAEIVAPRHVRAEMAERLNDLTDMYG